MRIVQKFKKSLRRASNVIRREVVPEPEAYLPLATPVLAHDRGTEHLVQINGRPHSRRVYRPHPAAQACLGREVLARKLFRGKSWLPPIVERQASTITLPAYPIDSRLDRVAPNLNDAARRELAGQAVAILFDIFAAGWAHREFEARHLYVVDGVLKLSNMEVMEAYPSRQRPAFLKSYDVTGKGGAEGLSLAQAEDARVYFESPHPMSPSTLLGQRVNDQFGRLQDDLRRELHETSTTFHKYGGRHVCSAGRTYGSFALPYLSVEPGAAQRNSARRIENFGVRPEDVRGATTLDLGSNIGAMTFELQRFEPARSVGVEYDGDKVNAARRVAALNGLEDVTFIQGDIDSLTPDSVGGPYDVVLSLAIEGHVADPRRLFRFLGEVTTRTLYFEGNLMTDIHWVESNLREHGFAVFEPRGLSDDDCQPTNRNRPLLVARKAPA